MNKHIQTIRAKFNAEVNSKTADGSFIDGSQILKNVLLEIGFIEQSGNWIAPEDSEEWNAYLDSKTLDFDPLNGFKPKIEKPRPMVRQYGLEEILKLL